MNKEKEIERNNPFKAKDGETTCNSCLNYNRCIKLKKSDKFLNGCEICKIYEANLEADK